MVDDSCFNRATRHFVGFYKDITAEIVTYSTYFWHSITYFRHFINYIHVMSEIHGDVKII